jgi:branched-subunit amino acid ABC-type transport system permease component
LLRRVVQMLVLGVALGAALGGLVGRSASAQSSGAAEKIQGLVINRTEKDGKPARDPVEGVHITVTTPDGKAVGEASTDAKGAYEIDLPSDGTYVLKLDESTLPKGVVVLRTTPVERTVSVRPQETQIGNFFLGKDLRKREGRISILPQTIANGLKFGLIIAICSVGLSLIYGTTGLTNFAHGELVGLGAIVTWYFNQEGPQFHLLVASLFGIAAAALAGYLMEAGVWAPLRRRGIGLTSMMIISIGIGLTARYLFQFYFGGRSRAYRQYAVQKDIDFGPFSLTPHATVSMIICLAVLIGVALFLIRARTGKAIRAVSDNPDLASATGINTERVILIVWVFGGGLAGLGGILLGLEQQVAWDRGFNLLLLMFAAITLGGLGNPFGALVGSLAVGLFTELWTWIFPTVVELKNLGALLFLIVVLLIRPQGLLGRAERVG